MRSQETREVLLLRTRESARLGLFTKFLEVRFQFRHSLLRFRGRLVSFCDFQAKPFSLYACVCYVFLRFRQILIYVEANGRIAGSSRSGREPDLGGGTLAGLPSCI